MFKQARAMQYAENELIITKTNSLLEKLTAYLSDIEQDSEIFIPESEVVYIPDLHGDFVHLISVLYRHGVLDSNLDLSLKHRYVFLGDIYDRTPDSDSIDCWLNKQIRNGASIVRLLGNHELGFLLRKPDGYPELQPAQDAIKDAFENFRITESLLKNLSEGNILGAYVDEGTLYAHSFVIEEDFIRVGLSVDDSILSFAKEVNSKLKAYASEAYEIYKEADGSVNWKKINEIFQNDPIFNVRQKVNEINTSFFMRRTGIPDHKTYPVDIDANLPKNITQIVGHTPVALFNIKGNQVVKKPFVLEDIELNSRIQFSDVGIGYSYKDDSLVRPEVIISKKHAVRLQHDVS